MCPLSSRWSCPVAASQIRTALLQLPLATCTPFGENATEETQSPRPLSSRWSCPVAASQIRMSLLPLATRAPFGENVTELTLSLCPLSSR